MLFVILLPVCSENLLSWSDPSCTDLSHPATTGASWCPPLVARSLICTSPPAAAATTTAVTTAVPSHQNVFTPPTTRRLPLVVIVSLESHGSRRLGSGAAVAAAAVVVARSATVVVMPSRDADGMSKSLYADVLVDNPAERRFCYAGAAAQAIASERGAGGYDDHLSQPVELYGQQRSWALQVGRGGGGHPKDAFQLNFSKHVGEES